MAHRPTTTPDPDEPGELRDTRPGDAVGADPPQAGPGEDEAARIARERDEFKDLLLRKIAEFDNYRKRIERDRRDREADAAAELLTELLPLVDDFERALKAEAGTSVDAYRSGIEIIHKQLMDILRRRGVVPIEALGKDFDPHFHQAVDHVASPDHRDGEVIDEFRRGYLLGERLLRPAMVRVAKA